MTSPLETRSCSSTATGGLTGQTPDLSGDVSLWLLNRLSRNPGHGIDTGALKRELIIELKSKKIPKEGIPELLKAVRGQLECASSNVEGFQRDLLTVISAPAYWDNLAGEIVSSYEAPQGLRADPYANELEIPPGRDDTHRLSLDFSTPLLKKLALDGGVLSGIAGSDMTVLYARISKNRERRLGPLKLSIDGTVGPFMALPHQKSDYTPYRDSVEFVVLGGTTAAALLKHQPWRFLDLRAGAQLRPWIAGGVHHTLEYEIPLEMGASATFRLTPKSAITVGAEGKIAFDLKVDSLEPHLAPVNVSPFFQFTYGDVRFETAMDVFSEGRELKGMLAVPLMRTHHGTPFVGANFFFNMDPKVAAYPQYFGIHAGWRWGDRKGHRARLLTNITVETGAGLAGSSVNHDLQEALEEMPKEFMNGEFVDPEREYNCFARLRDSGPTCYEPGGNIGFGGCRQIEDGQFECQTALVRSQVIARGNFRFRRNAANYYNVTDSSYVLDDMLLENFQEATSFADFMARMQAVPVNKFITYLNYLARLLYRTYDHRAVNTVEVAETDDEAIFEIIRREVFEPSDEAPPTAVCRNFAMIIARMATARGLKAYAAGVPDRSLSHVVALIRDSETGTYHVINRGGAVPTGRTIQEALMSYSRGARMAFKLYDGETSRFLRTIETPLGHEVAERMGPPPRLQWHVRGR